MMLDRFPVNSIMNIIIIHVYAFRLILFKYVRAFPHVIISKPRYRPYKTAQLIEKNNS